MLRFVSVLLLPAVLYLSCPSSAAGFWRPPGSPPGWRYWMKDGLSGRYISQSNGAPCYVYRTGRSYVFINDHGSWARFVFTAPDRLEQVAGQWDPTVVCTVRKDHWGRTVLRFDSPNAPPGFWVEAD